MLCMNYARGLAAATAALIAAIGASVSIAASPTVMAPPGAAAPPAAAPAPDWHVVVREFAAAYFKNPAWGYSHCQRDYALAKELAATDHVALDDDILFAAAYL